MLFVACRAVVETAPNDLAVCFDFVIVITVAETSSALVADVAELADALDSKLLFSGFHVIAFHHL